MNMETAYELSIPTSNPQPLRTFDGEIIYTGDNEPLNTPTGNADVKEIASNNKVIWERAIPIQKSGETPLSFRATRAKPLLEWSITGKTYQAWTPSPEPQVGNNKLDNSKIEKSSTITNFTYTDSSVSFGSMTVGSTINSAEIKSEDTSYAFSFSGDTNKVTFALKCYNSSHTYLGDANKLFDEESRAVMTLLSNTAYIRLVITTTVQGNISLTNLMLNKGNTVMAFEPFKYLPNTGACPVQGVGDKTGNLFDVSAVEIGAIRSTIGLSPSQFIARGYTNYRFIRIKCKPNANYTFSCLNNVEGMTFRAINCNEQEISISMLYEFINTPKGIVEKTFTTENTSEYIYIQIHKDSTNIMLNEGSEPLPYEPYGYKVPVVSRGKNLINLNGDIWEYNDSYTNYTITDTGYSTSNKSLIGFITKCTPETKYTLSTDVKIRDGIGVQVRAYGFSTKPTKNESINNRTEYPVNKSTFGGSFASTFTTGSNTEWLIVGAYIDSPMGAELSKIQLELGSTATEYEPYHAETSTIYLSSPLMSDEILDSTGKREVEWGKYVFTGEENFDTFNYGLRVLINNAKSVNGEKITEAKCSHFESFRYNSIINSNTNGKFAQRSSTTGTTNGFAFSKNNHTVDSFKAFLKSQYDAGHPVTVYYKLETPTSETVSIPQIPTLKGNCTIDVDTEVNAKNMSANYLSSEKSPDGVPLRTGDGEILYTADNEPLCTER